MAIVQADSLTAPDVTNLTADGNEWSPGIRLTWEMPASNQLFGTEIWRHSINNRAFATKIAVVLGTNNYLDIVQPNSPFYYWIRGVNLYGKGTGAWYPVSDLDGVLGVDGLPHYSSTANFNISDVVSDGTWITVEEFKVYNPTERIVIGEAIFSCQLANIGGVSSQFRLVVTNDPTLPNFEYAYITTDISSPTVVIPIYVPPNSVANTIFFPYTYTIQFHGPVEGTSSVARRGTLFNWDYVWY